MLEHVIFQASTMVVNAPRMLNSFQTVLRIGLTSFSAGVMPLEKWRLKYQVLNDATTR
jgi:hypothetical protein